jgi:putative ABC transport system substrate-binding protein
MPDVVLASTASAVVPLQHASRKVPIVFVNVIDPVGGGFVASLARPAGNATGFLLYEYGVSGKWLELLKQMAPRLTRAAVLRDPATAALERWLPGLALCGSRLGCKALQEVHD